MSRLKTLCALCFATMALGVGPAAAAPGDPLFVFSPNQLPKKPPPPPNFEGPCGVGVDSLGNFYVSDYYHHLIEVFSAEPNYITQAKDVDPLDGSCGLALDATGNVYVNNYHRNVEKFVPSAFPPVKASVFPPVSASTFSSAGVIDSDQPTGVAVDPVTGNVYVNAREHIAVYDSSGAAVMDGGEPLLIGAGAIEDGFGLARSGHPATLGRLYVPDAGDDTVKVFDPAVNKEEPVEVIDAADTPAGSFGSLRDSAVAVDDTSGDVYVADTLGPQLSEEPVATIQVFDAAGAYEGRLRDDVVDGRPVGLAVDNSPTATQGRVYVTSGNTANAVLYAYPPGSAIAPAPAALSGAGQRSAAASANRAAPPAADASSPQSGGDAGARVIAQKGKLRVVSRASLAPRSLPRTGVAPISVSVGGEISTTDDSQPPRLVTMLIELNRRGRLDTQGLPTCAYNRIQPASTSRALAACRNALVGRGSFAADITLAGQEPYPAKGKLLLFNGRRKGKPVLYGQIYSARPFATSFVIVFEIERISRGTYGTALSAQLPSALGNWGTLRSIEMTLKRRYRHRGVLHSYISAGCPAPKGFPGAIFPLARASFSFADGKRLSSSLVGECRVRKPSASSSGG